MTSTRRKTFESGFSPRWNSSDIVLPLVHTTAYQFLDFEENETLRRNLLETCEALRLTGNITLAPEGINLSLAGPKDAINQIERTLLRESPFQQLRFRHSQASEAPFSKLVIRFRASLLPIRVNAPVSRRDPGEYLPPEQLCQWLDEGRSFRLLDVRNVYETRLGRFTAAETLPLHQFRDFREKARDLTLDARPVVTYCTGGIRCELVSAWLREQGHPEVRQLSGGILHYLERCGGRHWQGECFVFDDRLAVDAELRATYPKLCRTCQKPLAKAELDRCVDCGDRLLDTD